MLRRGTALVSVRKWDEAMESLEQLLSLEPSNRRAQELLTQARKEKSQSGSAGEGKAKERRGRKIVIEEEEETSAVDGPKQSKSMPSATPPARSEVTAPTAASYLETTPTGRAAPKAGHTTKPMPAKVGSLKEEGNSLFRRGQYGEAVVKYSSAMQTLKKGKGSTYYCVGVRVGVCSLMVVQHLFHCAPFSLSLSRQWPERVTMTCPWPFCSTIEQPVTSRMVTHTTA